MNWEAISAIGEIAGAAAVVVTLAYLARQTRENTRALRAKAVLDANQMFAEVNDYLVTMAPGLLDIIVRAQLSGRLQDLTPEEQVRFGVWSRALLLRVESQFALYQNGLLDAAHWTVRRTWVRGYLDQPAVAEWWAGEKTQSMYPPAFLAEIENAQGIRVNMTGIDRLAAPEKP